MKTIIPGLPAAVLHQHLVALGKTRSGKSSTLRVFVEFLLDEGSFPTCIIDPKGDWWGLKSSATGKEAGYPIVIFGGDHADVAINDKSGAAIAELVGTGNRSCLIDLGGWTVGARTRFFIDFASTLFKVSRGPRYVVIDEAHNFAPESGGRSANPDSAMMLHWANRLASEGSGRGITLLSATQRPQKIAKDYLTSHETLIAKRVIHPLDRKAVKEWIDGCGDPATGAEVLSTLAGMKREEAWVWSPEEGFGPKRIAFPLFKTFDSFAAPKLGDGDRKALKGWAAVDLDEVRAKLAAAVEEAKANDPKALKAEIVSLKAALEKAENKPAALPSAESLRQAYDNGHADGVRDGEKAGRAEAAREVAFQAGDAFRREATFARPAFESAIKDATETFVNRLFERISKPAPSVATQKPARKPVQAREPDPRPVARPRPAAAALPGNLPAGEAKILKAMAAAGDRGVTRPALTALTGYKRSSRDAYLSRLAAKGLTDAAGDRLYASPTGIEALGPDFEPLPTGKALRDHWLAKLPKGEADILEILMVEYPEHVSRETISDAVGFKRSSRDAYISRLAAKELISADRDGVKASDTLFE